MYRTDVQKLSEMCGALIFAFRHSGGCFLPCCCPVCLLNCSFPDIVGAIKSSCEGYRNGEGAAYRTRRRSSSRPAESHVSARESRRIPGGRSGRRWAHGG